ncbi:MAG: phosphate signaling complex protein PhoU, partial [Clostridia bacterium]|nr:phosphate signaling complex protein PhoU [Clostridia bacterium]
MVLRKNFDDELDRLHEDLARMCKIVESMIDDAITSLGDIDRELGSTLAEVDKSVDEMELSIEKQCMRMLIRQQPVAKDLLKVTSALKVVTDLERIGDQAENIGEIVVQYPEKRTVTEPKRIKKMSEIAVAMIHQSVEAFLNASVGGADMVIRTDDEMDKLFIEVKDDLIKMLTDNSSSADEAVSLLMVAKYFEKIGDYAVNVAEGARYLVTG